MLTIRKHIAEELRSGCTINNNLEENIVSNGVEPPTFDNLTPSDSNSGSAISHSDSDRSTSIQWLTLSPKKLVL